MIETILLIPVSLLLITLGVVLVYTRRMREINKRYTEAKTVLGDIILSFKRDIQQQQGEIQSILQRLENPPSKDEDSKRIEELRSEVTQSKNDLKEAFDLAKSLSARFEDVSKRIGDLSLRQDEERKKISELEEARREETLIPEKIETVIPIRGERALARLTETELKVLVILADEGEKTALQIRDMINLTREHTARLMKTLYTRGYIERTTEKLPYMYRIKDEMIKILKKEEEQNKLSSTGT